MDGYHSIARPQPGLFVAVQYDRLAAAQRHGVDLHLADEVRAGGGNKLVTAAGRDESRCERRYGSFICIEALSTLAMRS